VRSWFTAGAPPPLRQTRRVDHYLRLAKGKGLGIKLREGLLEVKQRTRKLGLVRFPSGAAGRVEAWRKWSFPLAAGGQILDAQDVQPPAWIAVSKQRDLRVYSFGPGNRAVASPPGAWPGQGCALELCQVRVKAGEWWTLGFESFGPEARLEDNLRLVAAHVLGSGTAQWLAADSSYGYPAWLAGLAGSSNSSP
jgi:hypothetical protein